MWSMGPEGTLASADVRGSGASTQRVGASGRSMAMTVVLLADDAEGDAERDGAEANGEDEGEPHGEPADGAVPPGPVDAEGLEDAPRAVVEVHAQAQHGDQIDDGDNRALKALDHVVVHVAADEVTVGRAPREVQQVEHDE